MSDLFGHTATGNQGSLFGDTEDRIPHPKAPDSAPDPERVRRRLCAVIETARNAERMPWSDKEVRKWTILFTQMPNWLPDEEAAQLRAEFAAEMERLLAA